VVHLKNGVITAVEIPREGFNETTGIGSQCCAPRFVDRFVGLSSADEVRAIDAVSGATVTSEAIKDAVARAFE